MPAPECTGRGCDLLCPDRAFLCRRCTDNLAGQLRMLVELGDDVHDSIHRLARIGARLEGAPSAETLLPWNEQAAAAARRVERTLTRTAQTIAARRGIPVAPHAGPTCSTTCPHPTCRRARAGGQPGPACPPVPTCDHRTCINIRELQQPGTPTAQLARWIGQHVDWIRRQDDADRYAGVIADCTDVLEQVVDKARTRLFRVSQCTEILADDMRCTGSLYALLRDADRDQLLPAALICDDCGFEVPSTKWGSWARQNRLRSRIRTRGGKQIA